MIELRGINKIYHMGGRALEALRDVSIIIGKGEFVSIIGSSDSGKSTLMNIIGCLDKPTGSPPTPNGPSGSSTARPRKGLFSD